MLQAKKPEDWVIATGVSSSVRDLVIASFREVGIELEFSGKGISEKAYVKSCNNKSYQVKIGKEVLSIDPNYYRPTEVDFLVGDPSKAKNKLGWVPEYDLLSLVKEMIESDLELFRKYEN